MKLADCTLTTAILCAGLLLVLIFSGGYAGASGQTSVNYAIARDVIDGGGGTRSSANYRLDDSVAQSSAIGSSQTATTKLSEGFWIAGELVAPLTDVPQVILTMPDTSLIVAYDDTLTLNMQIQASETADDVVDCYFAITVEDTGDTYYLTSFKLTPTPLAEDVTISADCPETAIYENVLMTEACRGTYTWKVSFVKAGISVDDPFDTTDSNVLSVSTVSFTVE